MASALPEDRYVTYYAEGFPSYWNSKHLFNTWKDVVNAFVPMKRNAKGLKFGFVRFVRTGVSESARTRRLNSVNVREFPTLFNLARFGVGSRFKRTPAPHAPKGRYHPRVERSNHIPVDRKENGKLPSTLESQQRRVKETVHWQDQTKDSRSFKDVAFVSKRSKNSGSDSILCVKNQNSEPNWLARSLMGTLKEGFKTLKVIPEKRDTWAEI